MEGANAPLGLRQLYPIGSVHTENGSHDVDDTYELDIVPTRFFLTTSSSELQDGTDPNRNRLGIERKQHVSLSRNDIPPLSTGVSRCEPAGHSFDCMINRNFGV